MTTYRVLWFDEKQHIIKSKHMDCRTDTAVIHQADLEAGRYLRLEIWDNMRPVCIGGSPAEAVFSLPSNREFPFATVNSCVQATSADSSGAVTYPPIQ